MSIRKSSENDRTHAYDVRRIFGLGLGMRVRGTAGWEPGSNEGGKCKGGGRRGGRRDTQGGGSREKLEKNSEVA